MNQNILRRNFFSPNFQRSQALQDYINDVKRLVALIEPDESQDIVFESEPGQLYRLVSMDLHSATFMQTTNLSDVASQAVNTDILPTGFSPKELILAPRNHDTACLESSQRPCRSYICFNRFSAT